MLDIEQANQTTVDRMMEAQPVLVGVGKALEVIPGMREDLLLHAGPPMTVQYKDIKVKHLGKSADATSRSVSATKRRWRSSTASSRGTR